MSSAAPAAVPQQINLYNAGLRPARESFSARQLTTWMVIVSLGLGAVGWWATQQIRDLRREMTGQPAAAPPAEVGPSPQQIAALEQALRDRQAQRDARTATRDGLRRGLAGSGKGPSGVMQTIADTIPGPVWITELRVAGSRIDVSGRALDAAAVDAWLERLRSAGFVAEHPAAALRVERADAAAASAAAPAKANPGYLFQISAALAAPFAEEGARR